MEPLRLRLFIFNFIPSFILGSALLGFPGNAQAQQSNADPQLEQLKQELRETQKVMEQGLAGFVQVFKPMMQIPLLVEEIAPLPQMTALHKKDGPDVSFGVAGSGSESGAQLGLNASIIGANQAFGRIDLFGLNHVLRGRVSADVIPLNALTTLGAAGANAVAFKIDIVPIAAEGQLTLDTDAKNPTGASNSVVATGKSNLVLSPDFAAQLLAVFPSGLSAPGALESGVRASIGPALAVAHDADVGNGSATSLAGKIALRGNLLVGLGEGDSIELGLGGKYVPGFFSLTQEKLLYGLGLASYAHWTHDFTDATSLSIGPELTADKYEIEGNKPGGGADGNQNFFGNATYNAVLGASITLH